MNHLQKNQTEELFTHSPNPHQNTQNVHHKAHVQDALPGQGVHLRRSTKASPSGEIASASDSRRSSLQGRDYEVPDNWENVNELAATSPVDERRHSRQDLETFHQHGSNWQNAEETSSERHGRHTTVKGPERRTSGLATQLYAISYLIFFSLLGTLARLGLTALTKYPGTPIIFTTIWANVGGSFIVGFLMEDRRLFRHEWGHNDLTHGDKNEYDETTIAATKKAHLAVKKTIPLYIGLATGFCGSMTSFSTFIKDAFLALSNDMLVPGAPELPRSRNGGYSFMAMLAIIITTVALSISGLIAGAHFAAAMQPIIPSLPFRFTRKIIDPLFVVLAWGSWLGAILLCIFPPRDYWRQRAAFPLVFAPLGCLLRFYLAVYLNGKKPSFPLGTFVANILGTVTLGMAWDIAHAGVGGVVGCQVLQGIEEGFCGCLTTISTWVAELASLRRKHAYVYGVISVMVALALLVVIMGGMRWTHGFDQLLC